MKLKNLLLAASLLVIASSPAKAAIIDFEGASGSAFGVGNFMDVGDYRFTLTGGNNAGELITNQANLVESNTNKLFALNHTEFTMTRIDNTTFDLLSIDIGGSWIDSSLHGRWADRVDLISSDGTVSVNLDGVPAVYQNVVPGFTDVASVLFRPIINDNLGGNNYEFVIDNISLIDGSDGPPDPVPGPLSIVLLGAGLIGLGLRRRK